MQLEYLPPSSDDERDVLAQFEAGELDEEYVIKHVHDYPTHAVRTPFVAPKDLVCLLIARMDHWLGRERPAQSAKPTARPAVP